MKKFLMAVLVALPLSMATALQAKEAEYVGGSPELQNRVMAVSGELRCLVCQGQSLADSNSDFAKDMREQIQEMMNEGMTNSQVVDFMVERYGDYVRYRPPLNATTIALWFGPFLLLGIGVIVLYSNVLRRKKAIQQAEAPLSAEEHNRAAELLRSNDSGEGKA